MVRLSVVGGSEEGDALAKIEARIAAEEDRGLLRFLTCGSVDYGKSTLIGRLLYDSHLVFDDQIQAATELGFRFHAARGSMSVGESQGGLPPDSVVDAWPRVR